MPESCHAGVPPVARLAGDLPPEWTLGDLFAIFYRRRSWLFLSVALCSAIATLYWLCVTPRYRATAILEIQKQPQGGFGLDTATADGPVNAASDSFSDNLALQTEIGILQSDAVALAAILRAGLETTPDYFAPRRSRFLSGPMGGFRRMPLESLSIPLADAPNRRAEALRIFARHVRISPLAGTRLLSLAYSDPDPVRSAAVVNALVQSLAEAGSAPRASATAQSAAWLQAQMAGLRQQVEALDARAAALDREAGAFGDDDAHNVVLARLDDLNTALNNAQSNRIVREALWRAVQSGDPEAISGLSGNPGAGAGSATRNDLALLQSLRAQEATAQAQIAESAGRYGENWPALAEQRAGLATLRQSIQEEAQRLGERARTDYRVAQQAEDSARSAFDQQKQIASQLTGKAVALRLARQEAAESRNLYTTLESRLQQAGVLEGLHSGNFVVIAPALVPAPNHPSTPNLPLLVLLALGGGLTVGCAGAVIRELSDNTIHSAADLQALADIPLLAALPPVQPKARWYQRIVRDPTAGQQALAAQAGSAFALPEAPSGYRDALDRLLAGLLLPASGQVPQLILLTPAAAAECSVRREAGSSYCEQDQPSLGLSLAAILAQDGVPVLYLDADLRAAPHPGIFPIAPGLSDLLVSDQAPDYSHPFGRAPLLSVLTSGARLPSTAAVIGSERMARWLAAWREEFAYIVIDGPAISFADALLLAYRADAILLTARANKTKVQELQFAWRTLSRQASQNAVLGLVLQESAGGLHALV